MTHESAQYKVFKVFNITVLTLIGAVMVFPYLNTLAKAFNDGLDTGMGGITIYPRVFTLVNFRALLKDMTIMMGAFISVIRVLLGTIIALIVQFSAAYAFTKKDLRGRGAMLVFLLLPMYFSGGLIAVYVLYHNLHLFNTIWVYILPGAFSIYNMVIIRAYLYTIPDSLRESARLDGANEIVIMLRVIIPLAKPIIATISLWAAVSHWNDWTTTLFFITSKRLYTMSFILYRILREAAAQEDVIREMIKRGAGANIRVNITSEAIKSAQVIITTIPIILIYPFLQKYFIKGIMIGAIKD